MTLLLLCTRHHDYSSYLVVLTRLVLCATIICFYASNDRTFILTTAFNFGTTINFKQSFSFKNSFIVSSSQKSFQKKNAKCVSSISVTTTSTNTNDSSSSSSNTAANDNYNKIKNALFSPSGKSTVSPEIIIPDPKDPTALLLLSSSIQTLSSRVRTGMANIAFVQCITIDSIQTFALEQQNALGNFPSPVPIIYCPTTTTTSTSTSTSTSTTTQYTDELLSQIADTGANGILISLQCQVDGTISDIDEWKAISQRSLAVGLQPIPEIIVQSDIVSSLTESHIENIIEALTTASNNTPAACIISVPLTDTMNKGTKVDTGEEDDEDDDDIGVFKLIQNVPNEVSESASTISEEDSTVSITLPSIPKTVSKQVPLLGSVRVLAGDNRLSVAATTIKNLGYSGLLLRVECIPGYTNIQYDISIISQFWLACIQDIKSLKSKNFGFRTKNNMDMTTADKWIRYRKSVLASGALGDPNEDKESMSDIDTAGGDYRGFA